MGIFRAEKVRSNLVTETPGIHTDIAVAKALGAMNILVISTVER